MMVLALVMISGLTKSQIVQHPLNAHSQTEEILNIWPCKNENPWCVNFVEDSQSILIDNPLYTLVYSNVDDRWDKNPIDITDLPTELEGNNGTNLLKIINCIDITSKSTLCQNLNKDKIYRFKDRTLGDYKEPRTYKLKDIDNYVTNSNTGNLENRVVNEPIRNQA